MPRRPDDVLYRVVLPLMLTGSVALTGLLFVRTQARRGVRDPHATPAAAPAAGSVPATPAGDVGTVFQARVRALEARVEAHPSDAGALLELAHLLHDGHRTAEAAVRYRQVLALTPDAPLPYYDLASALMESGDAEDAAQVLQDRLTRAPDDAVALYDLGAIRASQTRIAEARRLFESAAAATSDGALRARIADALGRLKGA